MNDENTHAAINNIMFKKLGNINDHLYEVEFVKLKSNLEKQSL